MDNGIPDPEKVIVYKIPEVARILRISDSAAYRLAASGEIPSIRLGGSVRVLPEDLDAILSNRYKSQNVQPDNDDPWQGH